MHKIRKPLERVSETHEHFGAGGVLRLAMNHLLVRGAGLKLLHVVTLDPAEVRHQPFDAGFERRFLTADEVRHHARSSATSIPPSFAERVDNGTDLCFAAIHGDRLANYGWYAFGSVEGEHAAGTPLGLPPKVAYMYKVFTHPDFRGRRLSGACMGEAARQLGSRGVERIVAMIYWSNDASLRSCERIGFRRAGLLVSGPAGPIRIPLGARRLGMTFGAEADAAPELRRAGLAAGPPALPLDRAG